jgi:hypothetical protein
MGGRAILNRPIYAQTGYPIVPDFNARRKPITNAFYVANQQPQTLPEQRNLMLSLLNEKRV